MPDTITLSFGQYNLVYNLLSLTMATMAAAGIFFLGARRQVAPRYRIALVVSAVVVFIAAYHYLRIFQSWEAAYALVGSAYEPSGTPFNDAYRYADWIVTVPLLLVELVAVLGLSRATSGPLLTKLVIAATLMIGLGYPGEVSTDPTTRWLFWGLSMVPFLYILYTLLSTLGQRIQNETGDVQRLFGQARLLIIVSWSFYPIAYLFPDLGLTGAAAETALQVGYTFADIIAKAGFGVFIYLIARAKSEADGWEPGMGARTATA